MAKLQYRPTKLFRKHILPFSSSLCATFFSFLAFFFFPLCMYIRVAFFSSPAPFPLQASIGSLCMLPEKAKEEEKKTWAIIRYIKPTFLANGSHRKRLTAT